MMPNSLIINRLRIITEDNQVAYDELYHKGVNIIRGRNSSGKSTIIRFIFYVLGGYYSEFVPEALRCSYVMAEVTINGAIVTLKRYLEKVPNANKVNPQSPLYVYYGDLESCLENKTKDSWQCYGYKISSNQRSFSNILFEMLGLPEMKADSNITMHQILRLMYLDQESPVTSLFFFEQFDKEIIRETVAELLLGIYDEDLSQAKLDLISVDSEIQALKTSIKEANKFFSNPTTKSSQFINGYIDNLTKEIEKASLEIEALRNSNKKVTISKRKFQEFQAQISSLRLETSYLENDIHSLQIEDKDTQYFIEALQRKVEAIERSILTRNSFEMTTLEYCPACLTKLDDSVPEGHCKLCKSPIDNTRGKAQAIRIKLDLEHQLAESKKILSENESYIEELKNKLEAKRKELVVLQRQFDNSVNDVRTTKDEKLEELIQLKGFKEGEILQYKTFLESALKFESLLDRNKKLEGEKSRLQRFIGAHEFNLRKKRAEMDKAISDNGVYLLNHDEQRQEEFINAQEFTIDFKQNIVYLSNQYSKYSASSTFYLKMAARFALFLASLQKNEMMYPRLFLSDNMEDKGLEERRAKKFQRTIVDYLQKMPNQDYQLIFATSYIAEELDQAPYVVGEKYTEDNKSLKNVN